MTAIMTFAGITVTLVPGTVNVGAHPKYIRRSDRVRYEDSCNRSHFQVYLRTYLGRQAGM